MCFTNNLLAQNAAKNRKKVMHGYVTTSWVMVEEEISFGVKNHASQPSNTA